MALSIGAFLNDIAANRKQALKAFDRQRHPVAFSTRKGWLLFLGLALLLILPALLLANPFDTDGPVHVRWQINYASQIWRGHLFPRWLPGMNDGFGSPAFFFYPPALQWLGALFVPLLPGDAQAIRRLALALGMFSVLGAQGCRLWVRVLGGSPNAAVLAGALWLVAPYRAFVDTYQRCALAECVSLGLLPWLGFCGVTLARRRPGGWAAHALAIALLAYAHMPGMMIGYLFAAGHGLALVLAQSDGRRRMRLLVALGTSAMTGLAMAGAMLVPALSLLGEIVNPAAMSGERNQPHNWLLFSGTPWVDHVAWLLTLDILAITLVMAAAMARPAVCAPSARIRSVAWAMLATVVVVTVLNLGVSLPFWDLRTPLSRIQFPFRLLGASSLAICILAAMAYDRFCALRQGGRVQLLWLLLAGLLAADIAAFAYQRLRPRDRHPPALARIAASTVDTSEYVLGALSEAEGLFGSRLAFAPAERAGPGTVIEKAFIGNRRVMVDYRAPRDTQLALRQFTFTGWDCRIDAGPWQPAGTWRAGTSSHAGRVPLCAAPQGTHRLEAMLPMTSAEKWGGWLSCAGLMVLLVSLGGAWGRSAFQPRPRRNAIAGPTFP